MATPSWKVLPGLVLGNAANSIARALTPLPGAGLTLHALPETLCALRELLVLILPGVEDWMGERLRWEGLTPGQPVRAGEHKVIPFEVTHSGSILVYAADTRPAESIVEYARDADLLVHEAYSLRDGAEQAHAF